MKKKLLSLALVLAMALTLLPTAAFAVDACQHEEGRDATAPITEYVCTTGGLIKAYWTCKTAECGLKYDAATGGNVVEDTTTTTYTKAALQNHTFDATATGAAAGKCTNKVTVTKVDGTEVELQCTGTHTHQTSDFEAVSGSTNKKCKVCGFVCDHDGTSAGSTCGTCGYEVPAASVTLTLAASGATQETGTKTIKLKIEISATGKTAEEIKAAFSAPKATVSGNEASITLGEATDGEGKVTYANASFTMPDDVASSDSTVSISVSVTAGTGFTCSGGTTTLASYTKPAASTPTTPTTPTTPDTPKDEDKAPSTNAQGVPVASEVNTAKQANQAIATLKKTDADVMAERVMTNSTAASSFASLDRAVQDAKNIKVSVDVDEASVPSIVRSGVDVVGAALNASASKVALVVDVPSKSYTTSSGYQISMTMTGVSNPAKLAVPVIITLPMPSDVEDGRVVVLHYHDSSSQPDVIIPAVSGRYLRFAVTGFSDFVITDVAATVGDGSTSGFYTTVQGGKNKNSSNNIEDLLPAIAAMLSGDGVFVDVGKDHWAAKEIRWARNGGVMSGYEGGYFRPTGSTNRQQLWMVLARLSGTRPADMAMARQWAMNTGVSDGTNPTGVLSRQQLLTMLYRYAKSQGVDVSASASLSAYADGAKVASYAKDALSWAAAKGIVDGPATKLRPEDAATRDYFAVFLYRYSNG